jgi:anhydro-N-acetylmuramic acid kinase
MTTTLPTLKPLRVLGFMTGTSLDAADMAMLTTDGETIQSFGPVGELRFTDARRAPLEAAIRDALVWPRGAAEPASFGPAARAVADFHIEAARYFLQSHGLQSADIDLIGFHGQTVLHDPPAFAGDQGRTIQLGDAQRLANALQIAVAFDFRSLDVAAGGQGAPLAPIYHQARLAASGCVTPCAALNLGGVANITLVRRDGGIEGSDCGPANGMIDQLMQARTALRFDPDGRHAAAGEPNEAILAQYLAHPYFSKEGPKSLDRYAFSIEGVAHLSLEDAAATLTEFAARAVALGLARCSEPPQQVVACGGGRHNPVLLAAIARHSGCEVVSAETIGWRGDSIEAECFAYLAARCLNGLPISFPLTTGVAAPMCGGRIVYPER